MGFDLWSALGISPMTGLAIGGGGLLLAALLVARLFLREKAEARERRGIRLNDLTR